MIDSPAAIIYRFMSLDDPTDAHSDRSRSLLGPLAIHHPLVKTYDDSVALHIVTEVVS